MMLLWQKRAIGLMVNHWLPRDPIEVVALRDRPALAVRLQPVDGLEGSVLLNDGEEDFGRCIPHLRSEGDNASADVEPADLVDDTQ